VRRFADGDAQLPEPQPGHPATLGAPVNAQEELAKTVESRFGVGEEVESRAADCRVGRSAYVARTGDAGVDSAVERGAATGRRALRRRAEDRRGAENVTALCDRDGQSCAGDENEGCVPAGRELVAFRKGRVVGGIKLENVPDVCQRVTVIKGRVERVCPCAAVDIGRVARRVEAM